MLGTWGRVMYPPSAKRHAYVRIDEAYITSNKFKLTAGYNVANRQIKTQYFGTEDVDRAAKAKQVVTVLSMTYVRIKLKEDFLIKDSYVNICTCKRVLDNEFEYKLLKFIGQTCKEYYRYNYSYSES